MSDNFIIDFGQLGSNGASRSHKMEERVGGHVHLVLRSLIIYSLVQKNPPAWKNLTCSNPTLNIFRYLIIKALLATRPPPVSPSIRGLIWSSTQLCICRRLRLSLGLEEAMENGPLTGTFHHSSAGSSCTREDLACPPWTPASEEKLELLIRKHLH